MTDVGTGRPWPGSAPPGQPPGGGPQATGPPAGPSGWDRRHPTEERIERLRRLAKVVLEEPFERRTWSELAFLVVSGMVACIGALFLAATFFFGSILSIIFVGVIILAGGLRAARGIGGWQRALAHHFLGQQIPDPEPFRARPGFFGWLASALRDPAGWRALGYIVAKMPLLVLGGWFAVRLWFEAALSTVQALAGGQGNLQTYRFPRDILLPVTMNGGPGNAGGRVLLLIASGALVLIAPWTTRAVVYLDRMLMRVLLGPDPMTARVRSLEHSRAQTVDASAATLRRIERDLHDGTQAHLVALAMRLGQVKEKLTDREQLDLDGVRRLVDEAHRGAKEAIVELRDLARGIHPPVLDTGLEGALATLTARSAVLTSLQVSMRSRPTPAIEAISYFCVAELLANVAQHAKASRAEVSCAEHGPWLRIVVRDDGRGGASINRIGSTSSGLAGLTDRVASVDGYLNIASPTGGPTVVIVDLPLHA